MGHRRKLFCQLTLPSSPVCPQPDLPYPNWWSTTPLAGAPTFVDPIEDELSCLNLNITVPLSCLDGCSDPFASLPVLVFVHGGGLACGSSSMLVGGRQLFDATNLVRASLGLGRAIVCVTINYRVGTLGFLASSELKRLNESFSEPYGNYGFHDQRRALEWIQRYIPGFGGAADSVTIHGTSAGAVSCHYLTKFAGRNFQRAILSSGTVETLAPRPTAYHQGIFNHCVSSAGGKPGDENTLDILLSLSSKKLATSLPGMLVYPVIDDVWITESIWSKEPDDGILVDIVVGACAWEREFGSVFTTQFPSPTPRPDADILCQANGVFSAAPIISYASQYPSSNAEVVSRYRLENAVTNPSKAAPQWAQLLTDILFWIPTLRVAVGAPGANARSIFLYIFDAVNPFPGTSSCGVANHGVNDLYLFNVAQDLVPAGSLEEFKRGVATVQRAWIDFCHGEKPWAPVRRERTEVARRGPIMSFNNAEGGTSYDSIEEAVGKEWARQWSAVLGSG